MSSVPSSTDAVTSAWRGLGVLDHVRERLGDDEVGGRLDLRWQPFADHVDVDGQVEALDDGAHPAAEAANGEGSRMDPVCELAQLRVAALGVIERLVDQRLRVCLAATQRGPGQLERDDRVHQALLCAVVQVAHHSPARVVGLGEQARS